MAHPAFIFDGRNILNHEALYRMGFNVYAIGKAPKQHFNRQNTDTEAGVK
jgi:UDPglucose 6-dehydrogenase